MACFYRRRERGTGSIGHPLAEQAKKGSQQEKQGKPGFQHALIVEGMVRGVNVGQNRSAARACSCAPRRFLFGRASALGRVSTFIRLDPLHELRRLGPLTLTSCQTLHALGSKETRHE